MPFSSSQKSVAAHLEFKVAGFTIDALGRRWDPSLHPRDSRGRFIETGGIARVGMGGLGKVVRSMLGGKVEVEMADGSRRVVPHQQLTMVKRPDGTSPTMSVRKVVTEDARRDQDPARGDGKYDKDDGDADNNGIPDMQESALARGENPVDEDTENPADPDDDDPEIPNDVPEAYSPSRTKAKPNDLIAITRTNKAGNPVHVIGKIDTLDADGKPDQITLAGSAKKKTRLGDAKASDYTVIPFEDLEDPAALLADAEDDNGSLPGRLDNEIATDLVEQHAKTTKARPPAAPRPKVTEGGGKVERPVVPEEDLLRPDPKTGIITWHGRNVGKIEKLPADEEGNNRWKVTDPWGRTVKRPASDYDTARKQLAKFLNAPPEKKVKPAKDAAPVAVDVPEDAPAPEAVDAPELAPGAPDVPEAPEAVQRPVEPPATPEKAKQVTGSAAATQPKSTERVTTDRGTAATRSASGNLVAVKQGDGYGIYRKTDVELTPNQRAVGFGDRISIDGQDYEPTARTKTLKEFREDFVGSWLDTPAENDARAPQNAHLRTPEQTPAAPEVDAPAGRVTADDAPDMPFVYGGDNKVRNKSDFEERLAAAETSDELAQLRGSIASSDHIQVPVAQKWQAQVQKAWAEKWAEEQNTASDAPAAPTADPRTSFEQTSSDFTPGDRVETEWGGGTVTESTDRSVVIENDASGQTMRIQRGTPGFDRIQRSDKPKTAPTALPIDKTPLRDLSDEDLETVAMTDGLTTPGHQIDALDELADRKRDKAKAAAAAEARPEQVSARIPEPEVAEAAPKAPSFDAPAKPARTGGPAPRNTEQPTLDVPAAPAAEEPKQPSLRERIGGPAPRAKRPAKAPKQDYAENTTPEGAPDEQARRDSTPVLGDVPAERDSGAGRPDGVLPESRGAGGAADRSGSADAADGGRGGDSSREGSDVPSDSESRRGERTGGPRVPAAGAGDGEPASGRVDSPRVGERAEAGDAGAVAPKAKSERFAPTSQADLAQSGTKAKLEGNLAAIRLLRTLEREGRQATPAEQKVLARWAGWGSLPKVFEPGNEEFAAAQAELKDLLSPAEYKSAHKNIINAHYTDLELVKPVWKALESMGFKGGDVLEPGSGSGNFISQAVKGAEMTGVELDPITAGISRHLYPDAEIRNESFGDSPIREDSFDAVIGNVPFGNVPLYNSRKKKKYRNVHNGFIQRSLDSLKPGGTMAVVTSSFTLDGADKSDREAMFAQADLVGAVRLPNGAHKDAAGTDVATDVLIFRKRKDGETPGDDSWLNSAPATGADGEPLMGVGENAKQLTLSDYYRSNPDNLLGTLGGGYNGLSVKGDGNHVAKLGNRLTAITAKARKAGLVHNPDPEPGGVKRAKFDVGDKREGRISFTGTAKVKGKDVATFERIEHGRAEEFAVPATQAKQFKELLELRDLAERLFELETTTEDDDDEAMDAARAQLRTAYWAYRKNNGPIGAYEIAEKTKKVKDPETGEMVEEVTPFAKFPPVMGKFRQDIGSAKVFALEKGFNVEEPEKTRAADVLEERQVLASAQAKTTSDNADDAVTLAGEKIGGLTIKGIADVLGVNERTARNKVRGLVFDDPANEGRIIARADYLTGNVRAKWHEAVAAAELDPKYAENVEELAAVLPPAAVLEDLDLTLGSSATTPEVVTQFAKYLMGYGNNVKASYDGQKWTVGTPKSGGRNRSLESVEWGTADRNFYQLLESILGGKHRIITIKRENADGQGYWIDKKAGEEATAKAEEIEQEFIDWVYANPDVAKQIADTYTEKHRAIVPRNYDGSREREYEGMSSHITLKSHQNDAITRAVNEESVLLEHVVGSGKTFTLAGTAMELRRLGLARKPVLVVPGPMISQWTSEIQELYPNAKILAGDSEATSKANRARFAAMTANNDWDIVVMTRESFESIPVSKDGTSAYVERQIDQLDEYLRRAKAIREESGSSKASGGEKDLIKKIETKRAKLQAQLDARKDDDDSITFESLGFDYVMVDEAHAYKNLDFVTSMQGIASPEGANRARDMHMKIDTLRESKPKDGTARVAAFATGTPISNSLAEMYTMTQFMRPDLLKDAGIEDFDSWAKTFAKMEAKQEQNTAANGWTERVRMRGFKDSLGDALRIWRTFSDTKTIEDLPYIKRPSLKGGQRQIHVVPQSEIQQQALASLAQRVKDLPPGKPEKGDDTHVAIIGDGRRLAIDPRLMSERGVDVAGIDRDEDTASPKIEEAAADIMRIFRERKDDRFTIDANSDEEAELSGALQMVMIDADSPKGDGRFSSYQLLKDLLVAEGMPADSIRFIQEAAGNKQKKAQMMEDARQGKISVLIGNTESLGTGTNAQNRLYALHHIDASWKPSDIEQREGRILRQGNQYGEVEIHAYVTERSHDVKTWDMIAYKQAGLNAIQTGSFDMKGVEFADDVDPLKDFDTLVGAGLNDELFNDRGEVAGDLKRLRNLNKSHQRRVSNARSIISQEPIKRRGIASRREGLNKAKEVYKPTAGDAFVYEDRSGNAWNPTITQIKDRAEAAKVLSDRIEEIVGENGYARGDWGYPTKLGMLGGLHMRMRAGEFGMNGKRIRIDFYSDDQYGEVGAVPGAYLEFNIGQARDGMNGLLTRLENRAGSFEDSLAKLDGEEAVLNGDVERAQGVVNSPFRNKEALDLAEARGAMLDKIFGDKREEGESEEDLRSQYAVIADQARELASKPKASSSTEGDGGTPAPAPAKPKPSAPAPSGPSRPSPQERAKARAEGRSLTPKKVEEPKAPRPESTTVAAEAEQLGLPDPAEVDGDLTSGIEFPVTEQEMDAVVKPAAAAEFEERFEREPSTDVDNNWVDTKADEIRTAVDTGVVDATWRPTVESTDDEDVTDAPEADVNADEPTMTITPEGDVVEDTIDAPTGPADTEVPIEDLTDGTIVRTSAQGIKPDGKPDPNSGGTVTGTLVRKRGKNYVRDEDGNEYLTNAKDAEVIEQPRDEEMLSIAPEDLPATPDAPEGVPSYGDKITLTDGRTVTFDQDSFAGFTARDADGNSIDLTEDELTGWKPFDPSNEARDETLMGTDDVERVTPERAPRAPKAAAPVADDGTEQEAVEITDVESNPDAPTIMDGIRENDGELEAAAIAASDAAYSDAIAEGMDEDAATDEAQAAADEVYLNAPSAEEPVEAPAAAKMGRDEMLADYQGGMSFEQLGEKYGMSPVQAGTALGLVSRDRFAMAYGREPGTFGNALTEGDYVTLDGKPVRVVMLEMHPAHLQSHMTVEMEDGTLNRMPVSPFDRFAATADPNAPAEETETVNVADVPTINDDTAVEAQEQADREAIDTARDDAETEAREGGATEEEAELAGDVAAADEATKDAETAGERPVAPAPPEEPKTPRQLDDEDYPLSPQQQPIADAVVADRETVLVEAKAGAGKTSTLVAIAKRFRDMHPDTKIGYIAFNKSVQTEAAGRFPKNTETRTGHSVSFAWVGKAFTSARFKNPEALRNSKEIARHLGIVQPLGTGTTSDNARDVMRAVKRYSNSADEKISAEHFVTAEGKDLLDGFDDAHKVRMVAFAERAWKDLTAQEGRLNTDNDHIRKMWALSKPDFSKPGSGLLNGPVDVLFLDEAQDTPPVLAKVIEDQTMQKVIVGDGDQAIYGFTGAIDYLAKADVPNRLPLTKSYRFGPQIADWGNRFLQVLGSEQRVVGGGPDSNIVTDMKAPDAILTRSNGGMFTEILAEQEAGRIVGVPTGTKGDLRNLIASARYLRDGGNAPQGGMHEDLAPFNTWNEFNEAVEKGDDQKLASLDRLFSKYTMPQMYDIVESLVEEGENGLSGVNVDTDDSRMILSGGSTGKITAKLKAETGSGIGQFGFRWNGTDKTWVLTGNKAKQEAALGRLKEALGGDARKPEVTVSTAHKAKGLEWSRVRIGDDFRGPKQDKITGQETMPDPEELRLAYVAVTRAESELDLGSLAWVADYSNENGKDADAAPVTPETISTPEAPAAPVEPVETVSVAPEDLPERTDGSPTIPEAPAATEDADLPDVAATNARLDEHDAAAVTPEAKQRLRYAEERYDYIKSGSYLEDIKWEEITHKGSKGKPGGKGLRGTLDGYRVETVSGAIGPNKLVKYRVYDPEGNLVGDPDLYKTGMIPNGATNKADALEMVKKSMAGYTVTGLGVPLFGNAVREKTAATWAARQTLTPDEDGKVTRPEWMRPLDGGNTNPGVMGESLPADFVRPGTRVETSILDPEAETFSTRYAATTQVEGEFLGRNADGHAMIRDDNGKVWTAVPDETRKGIWNADVRPIFANEPSKEERFAAEAEESERRRAEWNSPESVQARKEKTAAALAAREAAANGDDSDGGGTVPPVVPLDADQPNPDDDDDEDDAPVAGETEEERKRRKERRRKRYDPQPSPEGDTGGAGGTPPLVPPVVGLGELPLDGDPDPSGSGSAGDTNGDAPDDNPNLLSNVMAGLRGPGKPSDVSDAALANALAKYDREIAKARDAGNEPMAGIMERQKGEVLAEIGRRVTARGEDATVDEPQFGAQGGRVTTAGALRRGDSFYVDGAVYTVSDTSSDGETGQMGNVRVTAYPRGQAYPVGRIMVMPVGREVELENETPTPEAPEAPSVTDVAAARGDADGMDWNGGNPFNQPAVGRIPVSPGLAAELAFYLENGEQDGNDQGYTLAGKNMVVHDKAKALSTLDAIEDVKLDQASDGNRGAASLAAAAKARADKVKALPDPAPVDADAPAMTNAFEQVQPEALVVGDRIIGKMASTGEEGELTVESAESQGAMILVTGRNKDGNRDFVRIPSGGFANRFGSPADDGSLENAWNRQVETERVDPVNGEPVMDLPANLQVGDVVEARVGGRQGRWKIVAPAGGNGLFDKFSMVPEGREGDEPQVWNASKKRPVKVLSRAEFVPTEDDVAEAAAFDALPDAEQDAINSLFTDGPTAPMPETPEAYTAEDFGTTVADEFDRVQALNAAEPAEEEVSTSDLRPEPLINGAVTNPLGLTAPVDEDGDYSPEQVQFLVDEAAGVVVSYDGKDEFGTFMRVTPDGFLFRPSSVQGESESEWDTIPFGGIDSIDGINSIESLAEPVDPNHLRPGTKVAFTARGGKRVVGVLERVNPEGRAEVRDATGEVFATTKGGTVRPVMGGYREGYEPTERAFAPKAGVWSSTGNGLVAAEPGKWAAGIAPAPDGNGYVWQVAAVTPSRGLAHSEILSSGRADTPEAAKAQVVDALYLEADQRGFTSLPGDNETERDTFSRNLAADLAELRGETIDEAPAADVDAPETADAPDVDGASAGWVPTGELSPGDVASVEGDNGNGSATTRTGHVLGTPESVEVHSPTGKPQSGTRVTVGDDTDGLGDRETILAPEASMAARAERTDDEHAAGDTPISAYESEILSGNVGDTMPTDSHGTGIFPGSVVVGTGDRRGVVREVWDRDVAVRWEGAEDDERMMPGKVTVSPDEQARPDGWTRGGRLVAAGHMVTLEDGTIGQVESVAGDEAVVDVAGVARTMSIGDLTVSGKVADKAPELVEDSPYADPPSIDGLDVRPTEPVKPAELPAGVPTVVPNLTHDDEDALDALGIDTDSITPMEVQDAAARVKFGMPITQQHADDLAAWLGALLKSDTLPKDRARRIKRVRNRLAAAADRGGDRNQREAPSAAQLVEAGSIVPGDVVALPNPATGEVEAGTVRGAWWVQNGQIKEMVVEGADGTMSRHRLLPDAEAWLLPDLDTDLDTEGSDVSDSTFTEPRVSTRAQESAQAVVDTAIGEDKSEDLDTLAADVAERLAGDDVERQQRNSADRGNRSLERSGVSEEAVRDARDAGRVAAEKAAEEVAETIAKTLDDAEPLPGESKSDTSDRVRDRLREAADAVDYDAITGGAMGELNAPTPKEEAKARREVADAMRADLFALADELAAQGNVDDANLLSDVAARLAGRPDEAQVARAVTAASMGRQQGPGKVRQLAARIRAMFARARQRFMDKVRSLMGTGAKAKRSLAAAVAAARAEWKGDDAAVAALVKDTAKAVTGDTTPEGPESGEPFGFADRVAFWRNQLPADASLFGRTEKPSTGFRGLTLARLKGGEALQPETLTGSRVDRAADGGPGDVALGHYNATMGLGAALDDEINARIRAALPGMGDDPAADLAELRRYHSGVSEEERANRTDTELANLRAKSQGIVDKAERDYFTAKAAAVREALASVRSMGPQGAASLNVQGRSDDAPEVEALRWAEQFLPTDWIASAGTVEAVAGRMGSYNDGTITVAPLTDGKVEGSGKYGTSAMHGLAHHLETTVPGLAEAGWMHQWAKTSTGAPGSRTRRGRNGLAWLKDKFPAAGFSTDDGTVRWAWDGLEEEGVNHYEWIPAGLNDLFGDAVKDDDLRKFMLGLLATLARKD